MHWYGSPLRALPSAAGHESKRGNTEKRIDENKGYQRSPHLACRHRGYSVTGFHEAVYDPRLPAQLGYGPAQRAGDIRKWNGVEQDAQQPRARLKLVSSEPGHDREQCKQETEGDHASEGKEHSRHGGTFPCGDISKAFYFGRRGMKCQYAQSTRDSSYLDAVSSVLLVRECEDIDRCIGAGLPVRFQGCHLCGLCTGKHGCVHVPLGEDKQG